jgi:hypothetical protein
MILEKEDLLGSTKSKSCLFGPEKKFFRPVARSFSFLDSGFFFAAENLCEKFSREYLFKLIPEGTAQQQNCLKIGRNLCHDYGR